MRRFHLSSVFTSRLWRTHAYTALTDRLTDTDRQTEERKGRIQTRLMKVQQEKQPSESVKPCAAPLFVALLSQKAGQALCLGQCRISSPLRTAPILLSQLLGSSSARSHLITHPDQVPLNSPFLPSFFSGSSPSPPCLPPIPPQTPRTNQQVRLFY